MPDDAPGTTAEAPEQDLRPAYRRAYEATLRGAKDLLKERFRLLDLARRAYRKTLDEEEAMSAVKEDFLTLVRLVRAWARRDYREVSRKTLLSVAGAVLYFVSPIDAIPDFIPVIGLADDVAVIAAVVRAVRHDLDRFRVWEAQESEEAFPSLSSPAPGAGRTAHASPRGDGATSSLPPGRR